jgi:preprotein translocase subunit SecG
MRGMEAGGDVVVVVTVVVVMVVVVTVVVVMVPRTRAEGMVGRHNTGMATTARSTRRGCSRDVL